MDFYTPFECVEAAFSIFLRSKTGKEPGKPHLKNMSAPDFAISYQHWFGPATVLRCPYQPDFKDTDIGLGGVPHGGENPIEHMQYLGPRGIRNRSMGYCRMHREFDLDVIDSCEAPRVADPELNGLGLRETLQPFTGSAVST